jgi:hypothetical protein
MADADTACKSAASSVNTDPETNARANGIRK